MTTYSSKKAARDAAIEAGGSFTPLPDGAFKESGTDVRTVLAVIPSAAVAFPGVSRGQSRLRARFARFDHHRQPRLARGRQRHFGHGEQGIEQDQKD